jgi:hypothetical protein
LAAYRTRVPDLKALPLMTRFTATRCPQNERIPARGDMIEPRRLATNRNTENRSSAIPGIALNAAGGFGTSAATRELPFDDSRQ